MSERTHSDAGTQSRTATKPRSKFKTVLAGTAVAVVAAAAAFQMYRAQPGMAQTRESVEAGTARVGGGPAGDELVARVNNEPVTYDQVARECFERHGAEVLENIINRRIIEQECERAGVQITQAEIQQEVIEIAKKFNIDVANWYALLQTERGIGQSQYHRDVIYPMIALKKLAGQNLQVTQEDMQRAFVRDYGPRVEARMILINGNIRQANEIWQQANANPDDFGRLAREHSADPNTRPLGGVIPPIRRFGGNEQVETEAFKLKVGEISPVIQLGDERSIILKCEGHTKPVVSDIKVVEKELHAQLIEEKTQEAVAKVFEQIKAQTSVVNYLTRQSTGPSGQATRTPVQNAAAVNGVAR